MYCNALQGVDDERVTANVKFVLRLLVSNECFQQGGGAVRAVVVGTTASPFGQT